MSNTGLIPPTPRGLSPEMERWCECVKRILGTAATGGVEALDDLSDVTLTSVSDGELLMYDAGSSAWVNENYSSVLTAARLWVGLLVAVDMTTAAEHEFGDVPSGHKLIVINIRNRCKTITGGPGVAALYSIGTDATYQNIRTNTSSSYPTTVDAFSSPGVSQTSVVDGTVTLKITTGATATTSTMDWLVFGVLVPD